MAGVRLAGVHQLPPGPRRDLTVAIYDLYTAAGKPTTRELAAAIRARDDLPGTLSHEGVSSALRGLASLPKWPNLESLVRVLIERSVSTPSPEETILRIHSLWAKASDARGEPIESTPHVSSETLPQHDEATASFIFDGFTKDWREFAKAMQEVRHAMRASGTGYAEIAKKEGLDYLADAYIDAVDELSAQDALSLICEAFLDPQMHSSLIIPLAFALCAMPIKEVAAGICDMRSENELADNSYTYSYFAVAVLAVCIAPLDLVRLVRELNHIGRPKESQLVLLLSATRPANDIPELLATFKLLGGSELGNFYNVLSMAPVGHMCNIASELIQSEGESHLSSILLRTARRNPVQRLPDLLSAFGDEDLARATELLIRGAAWLPPSSVTDVAERLYGAGRRKVAEDILRRVANTSAAHAAEVLLHLRSCDSSTYADLVIEAGAALQFEAQRSALADALDLFGLPADAAEIRSSPLASPHA